MWPWGDKSVSESHADARQRMVAEQLLPPSRGIKDPRILQAMATIPRHEFIPEKLRAEAYHDIALPIGHGQTISQPYIVAFMTEVIAPQPHHRVLEIGTGSGYQAAVLSPLVAEIHTVEIIPALVEIATTTLAAQNCTNVHVHLANDQVGWPSAAPYDSIIITCATSKIPPALLAQLADHASLILPLGPHPHQQLTLLQTENDQTTQTPLIPVRFVPMK